MLRGTTSGLEIVIDGASFDEAWAEVAARLAERPEFYRGSKATAIVGIVPPVAEDFAAVLAAMQAYGIDLRGLMGDDAVASLAADYGTPYLGESPRAAAPKLALIERAPRAAPAATLTNAARSLDADFAGARADFVKRRERIVAARERVPSGPAAAARATAPLASAPAVAAAAPSTLYHRGNLRGGQSLQHAGTIVVVGDVNPGAELTASGDILVFGALRGTAHAGAGGDVTARVIALELQPTQLRIATAIAAGADGSRRGRGLQPEVAFVDGERGGIAIAAYDDSRVPH